MGLANRPRMLGRTASKLSPVIWMTIPIAPASQQTARGRGGLMRLIGVSIRVPEEDHGAVCDLLTHYLDIIRQRHPALVYELAEEQRSADPALLVPKRRQSA
jgi:hypothetical protein